MLKILPMVKKFSRGVSSATRYFHFTLWITLLTLGILISLIFPTSIPVSMGSRLDVALSISAGLGGVISLIFWYFPRRIVEKKKKEGRDWSGVLTASNLTLARFVILPTWGLFCFLCFITYLFSESNVQLPPRDYLDSKAQSQEKVLSNEEKIEKFEAYLAKAEQGSLEAHVRVGYAYDFGEGVLQDRKKSIEWYAKAAHQGYAKAEFNLGVSFSNGEGVPQDHKEAKKWYEKAAKQGYSSAQFNLGNLYYRGEGVPKDCGKAIEWWEKAADQGCTLAQFSIGNTIQNEEGVSPNREKALKYLTMAAEQGNDSALRVLGCIYLGLNGNPIWKNFPMDFEKGTTYLRKAIEEGDYASAIVLGLVYNSLKEREIAINFFRIAAYEGGKEGKKAEKILKEYGRHFYGPPVALWNLFKTKGNTSPKEIWKGEL